MKSVGTVRPRRMGELRLTTASSVAAVLAVFGLCACLGACQDVGFEASVPPRVAPGVPIAVEAIEGPPAEVTSALSAALVQAAADHQVSLVDDAQAPRFRVKGYVTAGVAPDGKTELAYVWDVFDASNRRAQRVTGTEEVTGDPADPWARLDDKALKRIAGKSMDGIADFLASAASSPAAVAAKLTPQAVTAGAVTGAAVGAGAKPIGFAASE
jgi:hypothetical protein